jgi:hypothetical protein
VADWLGFGMQAVTSIAKNYGNYRVSAAEAKQDRLWQAYSNKMTKLQNAMNQNAMTTNENMSKDRVKQQMFQIEMSEMSTKATAEVAAAATGTVGRSVDMVLMDIGRNAARKRGDIERDQDMQEVVIDNQRVQSDMQTSMQLNLKSIPSPSAGNAILGIATDVVGAFSKLKL